jgi:hypothetical protein
MDAAQRLVRCVGCGAPVPDVDGPTHAYIGASPRCWQAYGELLARDYGEGRAPPIVELAVDAYAVQHPGVPGRRSGQSVAIHLMILCLVLERGLDPARATRARRHYTHRAFPWLAPPASQGEVTVLDVLAALRLGRLVRPPQHRPPLARSIARRVPSPRAHRRAPGRTLSRSTLHVQQGA